MAFSRTLAALGRWSDVGVCVVVEAARMSTGGFPVGVCCTVLYLLDFRKLVDS